MPTADIVFITCPILDVDETGSWEPTMQDRFREAPTLGVYLLAAQLEHSGIEVALLDWAANVAKSIDDIAKEISSYSVALYSANSMNWATARELASRAKRLNPAQRSCIGGPHPTHYPESVFASGCFDALFRGEADLAICTIVEALLHNRTIEIPGVTWCQGNDVSIRSSFVVPNLSEIYWKPAYEKIPQGAYKTITVETSRGCKFQCTFCSITSMKNWRGQTADVVVEQLEYASLFSDVARKPIISIVDNTFTTDHQRILNLCRKLDDSRFQNRLNFDATIVDVRNEGVVEALAPFTNQFLLGAEVSNKSDAKRIKKAATPELIRYSMQILKKYGIASRAVLSFIIGFPWHTTADCLRTVRFVKDLIIEFDVQVYLQWYWPMPGSEIWRQLLDDGKVSLDMVETPGFYLTDEWFYGIRSMSRADIAYVDERIRVIQLVLNAAASRNERGALEYSSPHVRSKVHAGAARWSRPSVQRTQPISVELPH